VGLVTEFLTMRSTTLDLILSHAVSLVTLLPIITPKYLNILVESIMLMGSKPAAKSEARRGHFKINHNFG
jgi:hypothetical protein